MTKVLGRLGIGACLTSTLALVGLAFPASAASGISATRIAGADRYSTAEAIAAAGFPSGAKVAVVASGLNYPDALAASYLAGRLHTTVLVTDPNSLSSAAHAALQQLKATGVDIVGGPAAVSNNVSSQLTADGYQINRIFGSDRYGTAQAIAETFAPSFVADLGSGGPAAIVASGVNFPDALSAGPFSYGGSYPILLTDPSSLSSAAQTALSQLKITQVVLMGGTAAVSANVATQITAMGITVDRLAGADRTQTAALLADDVELPLLGWTATEANLARGDDYADALSGGGYAGGLDKPLVLTEDPNTLGSYTTAWLQEHSSTLSSLVVFGGTDAISAQTMTAAQQAAT